MGLSEEGQSVNMFVFREPLPSSGHALQKRFLISRWRRTASWASARSYCSCSRAHDVPTNKVATWQRCGWAGLSNTCSPSPLLP